MDIWAQLTLALYKAPLVPLVPKVLLAHKGQQALRVPQGHKVIKVRRAL